MKALFESLKLENGYFLYYGMSDFVRITVLPACTTKGLTSGTSFKSEKKSLSCIFKKGKHVSWEYHNIPFPPKKINNKVFFDEAITRLIIMLLY